MRGDGLRGAMPPGELDRIIRGLQEQEEKERAQREQGAAPKGSRKRTGKQRAKAAASPEAAHEKNGDPPPETSSPPPREPAGPILFRPGTGTPLPDTADELMAVLNKPECLAHALGAMQKLGEICGRDVIDDNSNPSLRDFNPMIIATGVGSNAQAISSFVGYAVPLRRALARHFQVSTPDVAMMLDLAVIAYWKAVQAERASVTYLCAAIEKPQFVDKVPKLELVKELAVRQMTRLLEALRVATGRRLTIDPDEDIAKVLRFPQTANPLQRRARRASAG